MAQLSMMLLFLPQRAEKTVFFLIDNRLPFMDLIRAGEVLHVGNGTEFGLGRYEMGI